MYHVVFYSVLSYQLITHFIELYCVVSYRVVLYQPITSPHTPSSIVKLHSHRTPYLKECKKPDLEGVFSSGCRATVLPVGVLPVGVMLAMGSEGEGVWFIRFLV